MSICMSYGFFVNCTSIKTGKMRVLCSSTTHKKILTLNRNKKYMCMDNLVMRFGSHPHSKMLTKDKIT